MNYWDRLELISLIQTAALCLSSVALVLIAISSLKRTKILEKKNNKS